MPIDDALELTQSILSCCDSVSVIDERIARVLPGSGVFVDIGCGRGDVLDEVSSCCACAYGFDVSRVRLATRDRPIVGWSFVETDIGSGIPLPSSSVDALYCNQVVEHIYDPVAFFKEIHRVLKPSGRAVLTTPNIRYLKNLVHIIFSGYGPRTANRDSLDGAWDDGHIHYFTHADLRELGKKSGFRIVYSHGHVNLNGRYPVVRRLISKMAAVHVVREFLTGNIFLLLEK